MKYTITRFNREVNKKDYILDFDKRIFASNLDNLDISFGNYSNFVFKLKNNCRITCSGRLNTFISEKFCTFKTGSYCDFYTSSDCNFNTSNFCNFHTSYACKFDTGNSCIFYGGQRNLYKTGKYCVFNIKILGNLIITKGSARLIFKDIVKETWYLKEPGAYLVSHRDFELIYLNNKSKALLYKNHKDRTVKHIIEDIIKGRIEI